MKLFSLYLPFLAMTFLLSCKPQGETTVETPPLPASDFNLVTVRHTVADYDKFLAVYTAADSLRTANGMTHRVLGRGKDDPNVILVSNEIANVDNAKAFFNSPELKARMDSSGVTSAPEINFIHVVRWDTSAVQGKDRILISHRVKDYDAWLKAYDAEGRDTRASHGFHDRGVGRGIDDPNMVHLVFNVNDADKMSARMQSEEFKKLIADAGVEGEPDVYMYSQVD